MLKKKTVYMLISLCLVFLASGLALANDFKDTTRITWEKVNEPFFNRYNPMGLGARAIGMGEAFTAIADDASAVSYNPAGLPQLYRNELYWTGGTYYKSAPYTGLGTLVLYLGGQYFGLSYLRPYHPIGRYPLYVKIPAQTGLAVGGGVLYTGQNLVIPAGKYKWYGDLEPSWQELLADKYRKYINLPFQSDTVMLTYGTALTTDKSFSFGINIKYMFSDPEFIKAMSSTGADAQNQVGDDFDSWAWGLDMGFLYKLRIIEHLKDVNFGVMLKDISGSIKRYKTGNEKPLTFTSALGVSVRTTELIQNEITSISIDVDTVNDAGVFEQEKAKINFGFEQWFLDGHFAIRGGLQNFLYSGPWRMSLGISGRYIMGIDYAYVRGVPFDSKAENENDSHWISLYWMWGEEKKKLPTPDVFAAVEPIAFAPKNGETVVFKLNAYSKAGIDRWVLNIIDKNNNLVKSYVDVGNPPTQILWNGQDDKYQLLSDGDYTFIFEATDKLGSVASTPVQIVTLFTPVMEARNNRALEQLRALLKQIGDRDLREDNADMNNTKQEIARIKKVKEKPVPAPVPTPFAMFETYPVAKGTTPTAQQQAGPFSFMGFPNIDSGGIRAAYIAALPEGGKAFNMDYVTENTLPKYVMSEMAMMVKTIAESMGYSVNQIGINAMFGENSKMFMSVPAQQANNYNKGLIDMEQMLRGSQIMLNGETIYPNF